MSKDGADKFVSPCQPPEGHARELLTIYGEECAEVAEVLADLQRALARSQVRDSKALRFGIDEVQPGQPHSNGYRLGLEIGDLLEVVDRLVKAGIVPAEAIDAGRASKQRQLAKFMQTTNAEHPESAKQCSPDEAYVRIVEYHNAQPTTGDCKITFLQKTLPTGWQAGSREPGFVTEWVFALFDVEYTAEGRVARCATRHAEFPLTPILALCDRGLLVDGDRGLVVGESGGWVARPGVKLPTDLD